MATAARSVVGEATRSTNSCSPLRIALLSPPWFSVPPAGYGGIERVVALLADGLVDAGHEVTLFASGDSKTRARLVAAFERPPTDAIGRTYEELCHALPCLLEAAEFDLVHDHTGLLGLALGGLVATPVLHTVHGPLEGSPGTLYEQLCELAPRTRLVSLSLAQRRPRPLLPWLANVPNALDLDAYPWEPRQGDYLLFLGRMGPEKGCGHAIRVAQETGLPLKIAGKNREPAERRYFAHFVEPHLGAQIQYVGEVGHEDKVDLLAHARATLFPLQWEEPFGLVMIESMACGTPVVALRRGSVPEVVVHDRTGIVVEALDELPEAVARAELIDPLACRLHVEMHFAAPRMVDDYVAAYRGLLEEVAGDSSGDSTRLLAQGGPLTLSG